jgi:hypothetical protein
MNSEEFSNRQYVLSIQAGMNQRYHLRQEKFWFRCDLAAKAITAVFVVIGSVFAGASLAQGQPAWVAGFSFGFSLVASIAAVVINVFPFSSWERDHRELFRQWTDLREAIDDLELAEGCEPSAATVSDIRKLVSKMHRICGQERAPDLRILDECQKEEEQSRKPAAA